MSKTVELFNNFALFNDDDLNDDVSLTEAIIPKADDEVCVTKIENPVSQITIDANEYINKKLSPSTMTKDQLEALENKIEENDIELTESAVNTFNKCNELMYNTIAELDSISIHAIHEQAKILTESAYGSDMYNEQIYTLIESTSDSIFQKMIESITKIVKETKELLHKLGISISVSFVNYEKFVTENEKELIEKAEKYGDTFTVKCYNWNKEIMRSLDFRDMFSIADEFIPKETKKDKMKKIIEKNKENYKNISEFSSVVYCAAFAKAISDDNISIGKYTNRDGMKAIFTAKMRNDLKPREMTLKRVKNYCDILKSFKSNSAQVLSTMEHSLNPEFDKLIKILNEENNNRKDEGKDTTIKTQYYKLRIAALNATEEAVLDVLRLKQQLMREYGKELYTSLKSLKSYEPQNESISIDADNQHVINGITLHE